MVYIYMHRRGNYRQSSPSSMASPLSPPFGREVPPSRFLSPLSSANPSAGADGSAASVTPGSSSEGGATSDTRTSTTASPSLDGVAHGAVDGGVLQQACPPNTSRLDGPNFLHAFYKWSCREFSEPAEADPAQPARGVPGEGVGGGGDEGSVGVSGVVGDHQPLQKKRQPERPPNHRHEPTESLGYDGALQLYFRKRNSHIHEAAEVRRRCDVA